MKKYICGVCGTKLKEIRPAGFMDILPEYTCPNKKCEVHKIKPGKGKGTAISIFMAGM